MIVWKLDEVLRLKGVKGRELARRMAIGENYLSRVRHEVPDRLSLTLLDGLCRELGCSIADLLEYRADVPKPARPARKKPPMVVAEDEDFGAVVAEALGAAFEAPALPEAAPVEAEGPVVPQTRWEAEPVPHAAVPAPGDGAAPVLPYVDEGSDAQKEAPAEGPTPAVMVRKGSLGAKLDRLRQLKGS